MIKYIIKLGRKYYAIKGKQDTKQLKYVCGMWT